MASSSSQVPFMKAEPRTPLPAHFHHLFCPSYTHTRARARGNPIPHSTERKIFTRFANPSGRDEDNRTSGSVSAKVGTLVDDAIITAYRVEVRSCWWRVLPENRNLAAARTLKRSEWIGRSL